MFYSIVCSAPTELRSDDWVFLSSSAPHWPTAHVYPYIFAQPCWALWCPSWTLCSYLRILRLSNWNPCTPVTLSFTILPIFKAQIKCLLSKWDHFLSSFITCSFSILIFYKIGCVMADVSCPRLPCHCTCHWLFTKIHNYLLLESWVEARQRKYLP